jgi:formylglycine-generating enzyme required for sulfatase activity
MTQRLHPPLSSTLIFTALLAVCAFAESTESKVLYDSFGNCYQPVVAGSFQMGDPAEADTPLHTVTLRSFHIGATEVTFQEWKAVLLWARQNGYEFSGAGVGKDDTHPVTDVRWFDALKWCNAKSEMESLKPCYYTTAGKTPGQIYRKGKVELTNTMVDWDAPGYRLPTEAEWEKAARGGLQGKKYPHGDIIGRSDAQFSSSSTKQVATYRPNALGIHDMAGNVLEWCWDWYDVAFYKNSPPSDPKGSENGKNRVTRGGSWYGNAGSCRVSRRDCSPPDLVVGSIGFRVMRN